MKILATLQNNDIAPRFDLATEVLIAKVVRGRISGEPRTVLLPGPGSDALCSLIIKEEASLVICGGIEESHFQYLVWKKIEVIDRVIGPAVQVIDLALAKQLRPGGIVRPETGRNTLL
jgi:predicted Fe-Mo cluster-binding NifX family protein